MHPTFRRAIGGISDFINRPIIRGISKLSANVLETLHLMKDRDPLSMITAGASLVNSLAESFDLPNPTPLEAYAKSKKLTPSLGSLARLVYMSDYYTHAMHEVVFSSKEENLIELTIEGAGQFYIVEYKDSHTHLGSSKGQKVSEEFFFTEDFKFELLFNKIWEYYKSGIYLKRHKHNHSIELKSLSTGTPIYIGEHDTEKLYAKIKRSLDADISRSYLFCGNPGTGKSTCAMKIAYDHFGRVVKIDPSMARSLDVGELEFFVEQLRPNVLIFEDYDRAYSSADVALFMLENLKQNFPQIVIFATVNSLEKMDKALLRPGRFDQILHFDNPNAADRLKILKLYLNEYNQNVDEALLNEVCALSEDLSPAYLKELAVESRNMKPETLREEMFELVAEFNSRVEMGAFAEPTNTNDDDDDLGDYDEEEEASFLRELKAGMSQAQWEELQVELDDDEDLND